ncbi:MAG: hypothetical protein KDE27_25050 [Planctomycetes bacterium]|nr:hypothetical protein [Planctomycetota bacterium]
MLRTLLFESTAVLLCTPVALAQLWAPVTTSAAIDDVSCAYDSYRGRTIAVLPGGRTVEHDGSRWLDAAGLPASTVQALLCYQRQRARTLALVTRNGTFDTWEYDGSQWRLRAPDHTPPWRDDPTICYDDVRGRCVLFGGKGPLNNVHDDTWEWDGSDWQRRFPAVSPPRRELAAMTFDPVRGVAVLFGGLGQAGFLADHWEWNGSSWTPRTFATMPTARIEAELAFDAVRGRAVLYGGYAVVSGTAVYDSQPWEYDGQQWVHRNIANAPVPRAKHALVGVPGGVRIFGGSGTLFGRQSTEVFDYDGLQFIAGHGRRIDSASAAYDASRGRTVVLAMRPENKPAGRISTLEWDGQWLIDVGVPGPTARDLVGVSDALGGWTTAFGGIAAGVPLGDTWRYDGAQWQQLAVPGPAARYQHAMATDRLRNVVVLFGGRGAGGTVFGDTWQWNGTTWTPQPGANAPSARYQAAMAYDPQAGRVVLCGGIDAQQQPSDETWDNTSTGWSLIGPGVGVGFPVTLPTMSMAWSAQLQQLVLVERSAAGSGRPRSFLWTGYWSFGDTPYDFDAGHALAADPDGRVAVFGGDDGVSIAQLSISPGLVFETGYGCANNNLPPRLALHDRPRPGTTLRVELVGAEAAQPVIFAGAFATPGPMIGNCQSYLHAPVALAFTSTNAAGQAGFALTLPPGPALHTVGVALQAVVGELAGPIAASLALSDALHLTIGD